MKGRRGRGRGRSNSRPLGFEESFTFSITMGASVNVLVSTLANRPPRSNFRPIRAVISCQPPFVPGTTTVPGFYVPGAFQATFANGAGGTSTTTGVVNCGTALTRASVRYPRSADWWFYSVDPADVVLIIDSVCIGSAGTSTAFLRGTCHIWFRLTQEIIASTCPSTHLTDHHSDDEDSTADGSLVVC